jgi:hypothetical protein
MVPIRTVKGFLLKYRVTGDEFFQRPELGERPRYEEARFASTVTVSRRRRRSA